MGGTGAWGHHPLVMEMDADHEAARAIAEAQATLKAELGEYKVCLAVSDDLLGELDQPLRERVRLPLQVEGLLQARLDRRCILDKRDLHAEAGSGGSADVPLSRRVYSAPRRRCMAYGFWIAA